MLERLKKRYIGDKAFYRMIFMIVIPIVVQNAITNFVSLLDNIMVGQVGTEQMSGVSIANQLMFVYNLCIFGGYGGIGIFTAQFHGADDPEGIRYTVRLKMILGVLLVGLALVIFLLLDEPLIGLFLHDGSQTGDLALTLEAGRKYLRVMLLGLLPFAVTQAYTSTLREVGETVLPMKAGIAAVLVNLFFNWLLIYGHWGFPELGVQGAAAATVISRCVECAVVVIWSHRHETRFRFISGLWSSLRVPLTLTGSIARRGMPLLINETLWSLSVTMVNQCYSTRGLAVVAGMNIASTIVNLFNVIFLAMGNSVGIVVGKLLGRGDRQGAVDTDRKMIFFGFVSCIFIGFAMYLLAPLFPRLYNTTDEVRDLAVFMIRVAGVMMPFNSIVHASYFTLRCGGKTMITFLFDCVFMCVVNLPLAYCLAHFTGLDIRPFYAICQSLDLLKAVLGICLVRKGIWINNIVGKTMEST